MVIYGHHRQNNNVSVPVNNLFLLGAISFDKNSRPRWFLVKNGADVGEYILIEIVEIT